MTFWRTIQVSILVALIAVSSGGVVDARAAARRPVLMISIDGMRPDAVLAADRHGLRIPVLRGFLDKGSYAEAVVNVNPTVTNPNHTTLVTGVLPSEHGVDNNRPFAATATLPPSYNNQPSRIRAPTLWHAAKAAGLTTASIFWPVTRGAADIDFNLTEGSEEDDARIGDDAVALIERHRPELLTIHFVAFDHRQHESGPFSPEAKATLERIDTAIGRIIAAERKAYPDAVVAIVSDHGFFGVTHQVNLNAALVEAGFITLDKGEVTSWRAFIWYVGGMAIAVLHDPGDEETRTRLYALLQTLARDPDNGIERIHTRDEIAGVGLAPESEAVVALRPGYRMGNAMTGPLVQPAKGGAHGAFSSATLRPDMHSSFFIAGPGIAAGRNLGTIDIRRIAPTIAEQLQVRLPSARMRPLPLADR